MNSRLFGAILLGGLCLVVLISIVLLVVQFIRYSNAVPTPTPKGIILLEERATTAQLVDVRQFSVYQAG